MDELYQSKVRETTLLNGYLPYLKKMMYLFFLSIYLVSPAYAQINVTGLVTDIKGEPLPGVSIRVKGTTAGVSSGVNGKFTLKVPGKDV